MMKQTIKTNSVIWKVTALLMIIFTSAVVTGCGTAAAPQVVKETVVVTQEVEKVVTQVVKETVVVEGTPQVVEKEVTKVVEVVVTATPEPAPEVEQKLRIAVLQLPLKLDETEGSSNSWKVTFLMYDALVHMGTDGNPVPGLAVSWEPLDETTWQFKLREGVKFHNGEEFDAEAVKFSLDYIMNPDNNIHYARFLRTLKEVEIVDKYTVNIVTTEPTAPLVAALVGARIRPPKYFAEVGAEGFLQAPIGSGPFKLVAFKPDERLILERNEAYWGGVPLLETVEFIEMSEQSTRMAAVETGEVDLAENMPVDQVQRLEDAGLETESVVIAETLDILLVTPKQREDYPFLSDKRVRQALNYAVNKQEIVDALTGGYGRATQGQFIGPDGFGYDPDFDPFPYDPDKARQLLAEAGYPDGFAFKLQHAANRYPYADQVWPAVAGYLAQVGVEVEVEPMENAAWVELYLASELAVTDVVPNYFPTMDVDRIIGAFHSTKGRNWLLAPEIDPLIDKQRVTLDQDERIAVLHELAVAMADQAPVIWSIFPPHIYAYSPAVHDVGFRSDGQFDLSAAYIE